MDIIFLKLVQTKNDPPSIFFKILLLCPFILTRTIKKYLSYVNLSGLVRTKIDPPSIFLKILLLCPFILTRTIKKNIYLMSIYLDWYEQKLTPLLFFLKYCFYVLLS